MVAASSRAITTASSASFSSTKTGKSVAYYDPEKKTASCYHSHPPLKLPGSELVIYGGSCISPAVKDADVYIGFDAGMTFTRRQYPWNDGAEVFFKISDMSAPSDAEEFKKLVAWTVGQLEEGKKVHCGCIGGHGRTGTFLAALVSVFGEKDAIQYVRKNYCKRAVESTAQVQFLVKHFGVTPAEGHKSSSTGKSSGGKADVEYAKGSKKSSQVTSFTPMAGNGCIWG